MLVNRSALFNWGIEAEYHFIQNYIWDTLEIDWKEVSLTFNDNQINLPKVVTIKLKDKIKIRCLMKKELLLFDIMLKQGITWFTLTTGTQETI